MSKKRRKLKTASELREAVRIRVQKYRDRKKKVALLEASITQTLQKAEQIANQTVAKK